MSKPNLLKWSISTKKETPAMRSQLPSKCTSPSKPFSPICKSQNRNRCWKERSIARKAYRRLCSWPTLSDGRNASNWWWTMSNNCSNPAQTLISSRLKMRMDLKAVFRTNAPFAWWSSELCKIMSITTKSMPQISSATNSVLCSVML